jgi:hypothetical protein
MVLDGPMNGAVFLAYIKQMLAPAMRYGNSIIDNLLAYRLHACFANSAR